MRVKLDENIPVRLAGELSTLGHDVDTVASEGLKGKPDSDAVELRHGARSGS